MVNIKVHIFKKIDKNMFNYKWNYSIFATPYILYKTYGRFLNICRENSIPVICDLWQLGKKKGETLYVL